VKRESFLVEHHDKDDALWKCYKDRLGISTASTAQASISHLVTHVDNFQNLTEKFTIEEIKGVIIHLKVDKAPGPHGFNGLFMKKCWSIIKQEFIQLCHDFYDGKTLLENINGSWVIQGFVGIHRSCS
jgi:hypothetical protein